MAGIGDILNLGLSLLFEIVDFSVGAESEIRVQMRESVCVWADGQTYSEASPLDMFFAPWERERERETESQPEAFDVGEVEPTTTSSPALRSSTAWFRSR